MVVFRKIIRDCLLVYCVFIHVIAATENEKGLTETSSKNLDSESNSDSMSDNSSKQINAVKEIIRDETPHILSEDIQIEPKEENVKYKEVDPLEAVYKDCKDSLSCAEKGILNLIDRLDSMKSIPLFESQVSLERTTPLVEEVAENDAHLDTNVALLSRVDRYLRSHSIRVQVPKLNDDIPELLGRFLNDKFVDIGLGSLATDDATEGRGRIRKLILPLLLALKLKFAILLPIFISTIALISFKGLWAGLAAMLVSGALGLKTLFDKDGHGSPSTRFTLGVVKPHLIPEIYHSEYPGWSRSVPPPADHRYRTEAYYRDEYPYRGYYQGSWDRPAGAAAAK